MKPFTAAVAFSIFLVILGGCSENPRTETEFVLGTTCSITLYSGYSNSAFSTAFKRVREIENRMSVNVSESEISEINRNAGIKPVAVSAETYNLIEKALQIAAETEGALDISVGPLVEEWGIGTEEAHVPSKETIHDLLSVVNYRDVELHYGNRSVYLPKNGMRLDLGAIAKGYAADEAVKSLEQAKVESGIIDFGGNIIVFGSKRGGDLWRVGIQQPDNSRGRYFGILEIETGAVVSSGTYERYFSRNGIRYHHILNPVTGYPAQNNLDSVTIISDSGTEADGYSTAVFVMGLEAGISFIKNREDLEAVFVTKGKKVYVTGSLREKYIQSNSEYPVTTFGKGPKS